MVLAIRVAYGIASAWEWNISLMMYNGNPAWPYGAGYAPSVLILVIFNIAGYIDPNEDKALIQQRVGRGRSTDAELGITRKPAWWNKRAGDLHLGDEGRLRALTTEVGGGRATSQRIEANVELGNMNIHRDTILSSPGITSGTPNSVVGLRDRSRSRPRDDPFRDHSPAGSDQVCLRPELGQRRSSVITDVSSAGSSLTAVSGTTLTPRVSQAPAMQQQRIRSMLDI